MQPSDSLDILHAFQCNAVDIKYLHQYKYDIFLLHGPIQNFSHPTIPHLAYHMLQLIEDVHFNTSSVLSVELLLTAIISMGKWQ